MAQLCLGCMKPKQQRPVCEHCGYDERSENLSHQLPVGTSLQNQYLIGRVLGQGGFGITYLGWDQYLSAPVAIKEYFPGGVVHRSTQLGTHITCDNGAAPEVFAKHRERFLKEARTLARLTDIPEIVQIRSFFSANETAYIVMEYVQGITLKDYLKKQGRPMTEPEALAIMEPVLKALQKVHVQGLIHRDISPDNIMLPDKGGIKLIDFGTVRYMDDSGKSKSTESVLKPGFAPLEQYNTRGNLGTWTDVYAICATFHYLLTGKVPTDVHERLVSGDQLTALRNVPGISRKLIHALEKGMKIMPAERIQTVEELTKLLYPARKKVPPAKQEKPQKQPVQKEPKKAGSKKGLLGICAAAALICMAAGLMLLKDEPSPAAQTAPEPAQAVISLPKITIPETTEALTEEEIAYREAEQLLADGETAKAAIAFGKLAGYKDARDRSFVLWDKGARRTVLDSGYNIIMALRIDGTVASAGYHGHSNCNFDTWTDITSISINTMMLAHAVGLRSDGTVVSTGNNQHGQCEISSWTDIVQVKAIGSSTIGLRMDGTVVHSGSGLFSIPDVKDIVAIVDSHGGYIFHKADGTIIAVGFDDVILNELHSWSDIVEIDAAWDNVIGIRSNGTVVAVGNNSLGQCNVSDWTNIIAVSAGTHHTVGLRSDGTVVATGKNSNGECNISHWRNIVAVSAGADKTIGLCADGTVIYAGRGDKATKEWTDIKIPE